MNTYEEIFKEKARKKKAGDNILSRSVEELFSRGDNWHKYEPRRQMIEWDIINMLSNNHLSIPIFTTTITMLENKDIYGHYERQMLRLKLLGEQGYEVATELARDIWWLLNKRKYRRDEDEIRNDETILMFSSQPLQNVIEIDSIDELLKYA